MNNNYNSPSFPNNTPYNNVIPNYNKYELPMEQSYIENILRLNKGKKVAIYSSFPDASADKKDKVFYGIIEQSGRDHILLSSPSTGTWYLILMIYVNYIEFEETINYSPEFIPNN